MSEKEEVIEDIVKVDEDRLFVLLLRVTQANGRPLPIGGFTSRAMTQRLHDIMGVIPREVVILTDQGVVFEIEDQSSIIEVSKAIQGLFHWRGQSTTVDSVVATQDSITKIIKHKRAGGPERNKKNWSKNIDDLGKINRNANNR